MRAPNQNEVLIEIGTVDAPLPFDRTANIVDLPENVIHHYDGISVVWRHEHQLFENETIKRSLFRNSIRAMHYPQPVSG